jgi:hypothetical protein
MALPILIAWGEAEVVCFPRDPVPWWGFEFEIILGASGFYAQDRLRGFCGFATDGTPEGWPGATGDDEPGVKAISGTAPLQLDPYIQEIRASYREHMIVLGLIVTES